MRRCVLILLVGLMSCSVGYRRAQYDTTVVRNDGRAINVTGNSNSLVAMVVADARFARLAFPFEGSNTEWRFDAGDDGRGRDSFVRERRYFRLDAPVLSVFRPDHGWGFWYPGLLSKRKSLELWVGAEGDFSEDGHRFFDLGISFYRYNSVGFRAYGGIGSEAFRLTTTSSDGTVRLWDERAPHWAVGFEVTVMTGEYLYELIRYLGKRDQRHQDRIRKYGY